MTGCRATATLRTAVMAAAIAAGLSAGLSGCIGEEAPIAPYDRGSVERASVTMGSDYRYQIYYDLETGAVVRQNLVTDWDLALVCAPGDHHLILNSGKVMAAFDAGAVDFSSVTSVAGAAWRYDAPDGNLDSTAIGEWWEQRGDTIVSLGHVYVIDRGYDAAGKRVGYRKITITPAGPDAVRVRIASLDGSDEQVAEIAPDATRNLAAFSLTDGAVVDLEPPKEKWDLLFTRYTYLFYEPTFTPYSVTGVLVNDGATSVALDTVTPFAEITTADIDRFTFTSARDGIGYAWKSYDLNAGTYTVNPGMVFLVKTSDGFYYKLHFVDFYNDKGEKGAPLFEYQKL
jgi:hypothetical protein